MSEPLPKGGDPTRKSAVRVGQGMTSELCRARELELRDSEDRGQPVSATPPLAPRDEVQHASAVDRIARTVPLESAMQQRPSGTPPESASTRPSNTPPGSASMATRYGTSQPKFTNGGNVQTSVNCPEPAAADVQGQRAQAQPAAFARKSDAGLAPGSPNHGMRGLAAGLGGLNQTQPVDAIPPQANGGQDTVESNAMSMTQPVRMSARPGTVGRPQLMHPGSPLRGDGGPAARATMISPLAGHVQATSPPQPRGAVDPKVGGPPTGLQPAARTTPCINPKMSQPGPPASLTNVAGGPPQWTTGYPGRGHSPPPARQAVGQPRAQSPMYARTVPVVRR